MPSFPELSSGSVAKYPLQRRRKYRTVVYFHVDCSEQRFSKGNAPLTEFTLAFNNVKTADMETVRDFFNARRGALSTSWDLTLVDTDDAEQFYDHLQFDPSQTFEATEIRHGRWQFTLRVRQTKRDTI